MPIRYFFLFDIAQFYLYNEGYHFSGTRVKMGFFEIIIWSSCVKNMVLDGKKKTKIIGLCGLSQPSNKIGIHEQSVIDISSNFFMKMQ